MLKANLLKRFVYYLILAQELHLSLKSLQMS